MRENGSFEVKVGNKTIIHYFSNEAFNQWAKIAGLDKTLILQNGRESRGLRLAKTRAYVAVDEDENGCPIIETWEIKNLRYYPIQ